MEDSPTEPLGPIGTAPPRWDLRIAGGLFLAWIVLGQTGPLLELAPGVRAWYPPAALLAAACTLWGARALGPIIAASFATLLLTIAPSWSLLWLLVFTVILKALYWLAARTLTSRRFDYTFATPGDVARFAILFAAAGGVAALADTIYQVGAQGLLRGNGALRLRGFWIGDAVAVIALAPAMIVAVVWLARAGRQVVGELAASLRRTWTVRVVLQLLSIPFTLLLATALAESVGFFSYTLCFLPLGWIALTRGARVAALANATLTIGAVSLVPEHSVPLANVLEIQTFVGMLALTGLLVGSVADQRERAFALLGDSEARYRRLVQLLPDPLLVHVDGRVVFANGAAAAVLGASDADALIGLPITHLATARSRETIDSPLRALGEGRAVPLVHHTLQRLDGSGTVEVESVSIPFTYNERPAALTVARDVTARVRLEEELRHAQRMEAVGRLAGGVAHDFNNLLTVIISYSELMSGRVDDDEELKHDLGEVRHAADRAAALTRQLLSFSRRQVLQPTALELNEVVRVAEGLFRRLLGPEIETVSRLDPAAGSVLADRGQLEQVIMNLVVNARDAMPDGGVLTIETGVMAAADAPPAARAASTAERFATITVRDTGYGMDEETMRRIFDPFFTTKELGRGTGLGLATVHGIIQQSGGAVAVQSHVRIGSEFLVLLPALDGRLPAAASPGRLPAGASDDGRRRVLLVEDEAAVREGVRRILVGAGYDVLEAEDGAAALQLLRADGDGVDLLLTDIAMPALDGRQLARETRTARPGLPILLMSGYTDPDGLGRELPGIALLQKPLDAAALVEAVRAAMRTP